MIKINSKAMSLTVVAKKDVVMSLSFPNVSSIRTKLSVGKNGTIRTTDLNQKENYFFSPKGVF